MIPAITKECEMYVSSSIQNTAKIILSNFSMFLYHFSFLKVELDALSSIQINPMFCFIYFMLQSHRGLCDMKKTKRKS